MTNTYKITIEDNDAGRRLDSFLAEMFVEYSRSQIQKLIKNEKTKVNNTSVKTSYIIKENDIIELNIDKPDEVLLEAENIPLDIRHEDSQILVINKPKNMLTHPTANEKTKTLANALLYKYGYGGLSTVNGPLRPGILHRLDRNTSGLLMVAKNNYAHDFLTNQIKLKTAARKYLAIVQGNFEQQEGTINKPLGRDPSKPERMSIIEGGKDSITHYKILEQFKNFSFVELSLETGRTHQIRVHLSSIGHPIVNDSLYNGPRVKVKTTEQLLQAYKLRFTTPATNSIIEVELQIDEEIQKTLNYLRSKQ